MGSGGAWRWWIIVLMLGLGGCADWVLGEDPGRDPETNFEVFWETFDRHYAHFELKNIDWRAVYAQYRPQVHEGMTDAELFDVLSAMIAHLNDGHVSISSPEGQTYGDIYNHGVASNYNRAHLRATYLTKAEAEVGGGRIVYGWAAEGVGYIRIVTMSGGTGSGDQVRGWMQEMDIPLEKFAKAQGIIVDLRSNTGGRAFNAQYLAGRFASDRRPFVVTSSRNGAGYNDFSDPNTWYVQPTGSRQFTGPVVVLTNAFTFSAAEWMTLALRQFEHVTHIGTNSGGGLAMFLPRELPNGWMYTVSIQQTRDLEGRSYEVVGITPDIYVEIRPEDARNEKDTLMEVAIEHIRKADAEAAAGP